MLTIALFRTDCDCHSRRQNFDWYSPRSRLALYRPPERTVFSRFDSLHIGISRFDIPLSPRVFFYESPEFGDRNPRSCSPSRDNASRTLRQDWSWTSTRAARCFVLANTERAGYGLDGIDRQGGLRCRRRSGRKRRQGMVITASQEQGQ